MSSSALYPASSSSSSQAAPLGGGHLDSGAKASTSVVIPNGAHASRPRRAAAIASQAATLASTTSRRKAPSSKSSTSSSSTIPRTPQNEFEHAEQHAPANGTTKKSVTDKRPMAALPRAKRARRGDDVDVSSRLGVTNGTSLNASGLPLAAKQPARLQPSAHLPSQGSKHSIIANMDAVLNGMSRNGSQQDAHLSAASSTNSRGSAKGNSVREIIQGKEHEVHVVDDETPPPYADDALAAKGKRKAGWTPTNGVAAGNAYAGGSTSAATAKRRRKDVAGVQQPDAGPYNRSKMAERNLYAGNAGEPAYPAADSRTGSASGSYRGGYNADNTYYRQPARNGADPYPPLHQAYGAVAAPVALPPPQPTLPTDDNEGHFIVRNGEYVTQRYRIVDLLGQGTFGKVVRCNDLSSPQPRQVAIKIIRAIQKYTDAAQIEMRVLKTLRDHDPFNENKCIHLLDTFEYRNHVCIVSELLGQSVFDFLKDNSFEQFPPRHIWSFAKQLLRSVGFLHRLGLVHTDLKPENILLVNSDYDLVGKSHRANARKKRVLQDTDIRLIDFGSATFNDEYHSQVVSTRHYRAPEIIMQMGWSFPCDAWSIGCILIEFYTGQALFQTHDNLEHLAMMEAVLGEMSDGFRRKAETYRPQYFRAGKLDFPNSQTNKHSRQYVKRMQPLKDIIKSTAHYSKHDNRFKHLLEKLLTFDPTQRIRVDQALRHPYFELEEHEIPP